MRVLKDAGENFPAWLNAIAAARRTIFFEHYIVADDDIGREFVAALAERARSGVKVFALHDWFGGLGRGVQSSGGRSCRQVASCGASTRRVPTVRLVG